MSDVLFRKVEEAVKETQPEGAAIDIMLILSIISNLIPFIQGCFGNARAAIKQGGDAVWIAAWRSVLASGYEGDRGELTKKIVEKAKGSSSEEIDEAIHTASMLPHIGCWLIVGAMLFGACQTTFAGPLSRAADIANTWAVTEVKTTPTVNTNPISPVPPATVQRYQPSGQSRAWTESGTGGTSFDHLVGHGYDPNVLRNTPRQYWNLLHGDAHENRRSRIVNAQQPMRQTVYYARPTYRSGCPNGMCPN